MINIIKDVDLIDHLNEYDVILVGTNLYASMGNGFQLMVMLDYHYVYQKNLDSRYGDINKLGTIIECTSEGEPTFCICFIVKGYNFRPDLEQDYLSYEALEKCLKLINIKYKGKRVATTFLGASRFDGNGDRDKIMEIFNNTITDVDLTIYDYYQKSRDEYEIERYVKEITLKKTDYQEYMKFKAERKKMLKERKRKNGHRMY